MRKVDRKTEKGGIDFMSFRHKDIRKDRKTERQKDRRQKDRKTERQEKRETDFMTD